MADPHPITDPSTTGDQSGDQPQLPAAMTHQVSRLSSVIRDAARMQTNGILGRLDSGLWTKIEMYSGSRS